MPVYSARSRWCRAGCSYRTNRTAFGTIMTESGHNLDVAHPIMEGRTKHVVKLILPPGKTHKKPSTHVRIQLNARKSINTLRTRQHAPMYHQQTTKLRTAKCARIPHVLTSVFERHRCSMRYIQCFLPNSSPTPSQRQKLEERDLPLFFSSRDGPGRVSFLLFGRNV